MTIHGQVLESVKELLEITKATKNICRNQFEEMVQEWTPHTPTIRNPGSWHTLMTLHPHQQDNQASDQNLIDHPFDVPKQIVIPGGHLSSHSHVTSGTCDVQLQDAGGGSCKFCKVGHPWFASLKLGSGGNFLRSGPSLELFIVAQ